MDPQVLEYQGEIKQDQFVAEMTRHKKNGYYVEIGSNDPVFHNNTVYLERNLNWHGLMVECDTAWQPTYQLQRPKAYSIIADATTVDYRNYLNNYGFPKDIDYLQIDVEVTNRSTLTTLEHLDQTVMGEYTFATVTFEHDVYRGDYFSTRLEERRIFEKRGYVRLFGNVSIYLDYLGCLCPYEDWYCHPKLVDPELIAKIKGDPENVEGCDSKKYFEIIAKYIQ